MIRSKLTRFAKFYIDDLMKGFVHLPDVQISSTNGYVRRGEGVTKYIDFVHTGNVGNEELEKVEKTKTDLYTGVKKGAFEGLTEREVISQTASLTYFYNNHVKAIVSGLDGTLSEKTKIEINKWGLHKHRNEPDQDEDQAKKKNEKFYVQVAARGLVAMVKNIVDHRVGGKKNNFGGSSKRQTKAAFERYEM